MFFVTNEFVYAFLTKIEKKRRGSMIQVFTVVPAFTVEVAKKFVYNNYSNSWKFI